MSTLYSYETASGDLSTLVQGQSPDVWTCLCFLDNSMSLQADNRYGKVYKNYVGPGDRNPWNTGAPTSAASGQVSKRRDNDLGKWDWYALSAMIPGGGWNNADWATLLSVGYETIQGDQVAIGIKPDSSGIPQWEVGQNSGLLTETSTGWYNGEVHGVTNITPVVLGQTIEFVLGVKWATDHTGAVEVYYRVPSKTSAWTHALDRQNVPTYAYGCTNYRCVAKDMSDEPTVLDKVGLYYGFWDASRTSFPYNTLYNNGFTRSSDLATAEATLP